MSRIVTATKFRPQSFDELIGQEFVDSTLKNSLQNNRVANAYLLSGPRGVGKTSTARIIAKALNCEKGPTGTPCNICENCKTITQGYNSDVIEIDGASNTSINDIREIQEEILYPPVNSNYKVYIIDEVHMLSKSAFNALLKTIEEPPAKIVFIFATTEINKVLPTIRSRCQQFNFRLIPSDLICKSLITVLKEYNTDFEKEALLWIANESRGSMRDAFTLLDQVVSFCDNNITLKKIQEKLGLVGEKRISLLVTGLTTQNREAIFTEFFLMLEHGIAPEQIIIELINFFRNILLIKSNISHNRFIGFTPEVYSPNLVGSFSFSDIENILEVLFKTYEKSKSSIDTQTEIEICILKLLNFKEFIRPKQIINELNSLKDSFINNNSSPETVPQATPQKTVAAKVDTVDASKNITSLPSRSEILKTIQAKISSSNFQLATALNNIALIEKQGNQMILYFEQKMHYDIAKENEDLLTQEALVIIGEKYNKSFKIVAKYKEEEKQTTIGELNKSKIKDIFQGEEI